MFYKQKEYKQVPLSNAKMKEDFGQSLDLGESLNKTEKGDDMAKKKSEKDMDDEIEDFDDDFDEDEEESGVGKALFIIAVIIIAVLLALWIFTDWKMCVQF